MMKLSKRNALLAGLIIAGLLLVVMRSQKFQEEFGSIIISTRPCSDWPDVETGKRIMDEHATELAEFISYGSGLDEVSCPGKAGLQLNYPTEFDRERILDRYPQRDFYGLPIRGSNI